MPDEFELVEVHDQRCFYSPKRMAAFATPRREKKSKRSPDTANDAPEVTKLGLRSIPVHDNFPALSVGSVIALDFDSSHLSSFQRVAGIAIGSVLIGLLATAATLRPSQRGFGTHQQLGLPPCTIQVLYDVRCPACGMTTSWAHVTHGQPIAAMRANVGGTLLAGLALIASPWLLVSGVRGRWIWRTPREWTVAAVSVALLVVTVVDWGCRLLAGWR